MRGVLLFLFGFRASFMQFVGARNQFPYFLFEFCTTAECKQLGAHVSHSLNKSARPCDDFYQFSCGKWIHETKQPPSEPVWNHWQSITAKINTRLDDILRSEHPNAETPFRKVQKMYQTCLKAGDSESELRKFVDMLDDGWPFSVREWDSVGGFDWGLRVARVTRLLGVRPILKIIAGVDFENTSRHVLYIQPGDLIFPRNILLNPETYANEMNIYALWIYRTFKHLYGNKLRLRLIKKDILKILDFEIKLAQLGSVPRQTERVTVSELTEATKMPWKQILDILSPNSGTNTSDYDVIVIRDLRYLQTLAQLVNDTDPRTVANYIIWTTIKDLSRDTSKYMRNLNFQVDGMILGVTSDVSRTQDCVNKVNEHVSFAVVEEYVRRFVDEEVFTTVDLMVRNVKGEFVELLGDNKWLTFATKAAAIEKIRALKHYVGFPVWASNKTFLQSYYDKLHFTDSHFTNVLNMKRFTTEMEFAKLETRTTQIDWPSSPFEVNAYYSVLQNSIIIPLGILEPPFFQLHRPSLFNYGSLGSLIGHEISHALDTTGRHADKTGRITAWWRNTDVDNYEIRSTCFENQYNAFGVDGSATVGENIADSVGILLSFNALRNVRSKMNVLVPDLEEFTTEQLFFISFAQSWCEISQEVKFLNEGEHSPVKQRVLGTLVNTVEFQKAFACTKTVNKCVLW